MISLVNMVHNSHRSDSTVRVCPTPRFFHNLPPRQLILRKLCNCINWKLFNALEICFLRVNWYRRNTEKKRRRNCPWDLFVFIKVARQCCDVGTLNCNHHSAWSMFSDQRPEQWVLSVFVTPQHWHCSMSFLRQATIRIPWGLGTLYILYRASRWCICKNWSHTGII